MSPFDEISEASAPYTPLTIEMELSEPACAMTDVEEMILEQRGAREVFFDFEKKI